MKHTNTHDYAALLLRISLGIMFLAHGLLKVQVYTLAGTAAFFDSIGLPGWMAYPVAFAEIFGGAALIAGVATRWVSVAFLPILFGALYAHFANGWLFTSLNGGWEYPAFLIAATGTQILLGSGAHALNIGGVVFAPHGTAERS